MCTLEQFLAGDQPVAVVQEQRHEDLAGLAAQAVLQVAADRGRVVADRLALLKLGGQVAMGEFQAGGQCTASCRPQPRQPGQLAGRAVQQHAQRAMRLQQVAGGLHRVASTEAGAEKQRQQLCVGQRGGAAGDQLLAGTFLLGPVMDGHACIIASAGDASHQGRAHARVGCCLSRVATADRRTAPGCSAAPACAWLRPSAG